MVVQFAGSLSCAIFMVLAGELTSTLSFYQEKGSQNKRSRCDEMIINEMNIPKYPLS
ncbi:hypothetical protein PROSTU_03484 [Providencia stuartii ATCC 25827]|uniref:Uncharacterized protein n=1 Tax=Providencia stuartii ATCC 25827 TaxID=471874 RepID=A0AA86YY40_PROST|nr:hypothetical protein PROSTU_03484 [Providencia stuartii ATCC 25827]